MQTVKAFDPFALPRHGISLIEASAGTGKTFGIAALFVRWVLLEKKSVTRLLVLTFTKAATAELKIRLRARLTQILRLIQTRDSEHSRAEIAADEFLSGLFARLDENGESPEHLLLRLRAALDEFDGAGIYTIHSFCRSVLNDEAFLCGVPFSVEQVENQTGLIEWLRDDYWRREIAGNNERARLCFEQGLSAEKVLATISAYLNKPYLHYDIPKIDLAAAEALFARTLNTVFAAGNIDTAHAAFGKLVPNLNGNVYRAATFNELFALLHEINSGSLSANELLPKQRSKLLLLGAETLHARTKKGRQLDDTAVAALAPLAALGQAYQDLENTYHGALAAVHFGMLQHINRALGAEKRRSPKRSFDDLLLDVHHALTAAPYRAQLVRRLCASWDALMVDEFQDTDPVQYAIFKTGFAQSGVPVYLVGDPKQAIYSFRGADIFTYLQAAQDAPEQRYTLKTNYRAHQALVSAVAGLFARPQPFVHEHIDYPPVRAFAQESKLSPALKALTVFCLNHGEDKTPAEDIHTRAAEACADHMAQVLNHAHQDRLHYIIGENPPQTRRFAAGDIAVLVRNHYEARQMKTALKQRGIDSVSVERESVFALDEAAALSALLRFWLEPQQGGWLRFVLCGVLFQYTAADIARLNRDDAAMTRHTEIARHAFDLWQQTGIFAAYQYFSRETQLEQGLILRRAERTLTNLFQLLELLAEAESQCFGKHALLQWLDNEIRHASATRGEYALLRLENDESLVKIITIHKSKGLQYPLVYCPFLYKEKRGGYDDVEKIHTHGAGRLRGKNQLDDTDKTAIDREKLSEELRLLYVALTRAAAALVLCTADNEKLKADKTALDYLLEPYAAAKSSTWAAWQAWQHMCGLGDAVALSTKLPDFTELKPHRDAPARFQAKALPERSFSARRLTSFSAWARTLEAAAAEITEEIFSTDTAEQTAQTPDNTDNGNIHTFPGGIHAGLCWHEILESFDFARPAAAQEALIACKLSAYGFDEEHWAQILLPLFEQIRLGEINPGVSLSAIARRHRLPESGFLLNALCFNPHTVLAHLGDNLPAVVADGLHQAGAHRADGFFNGFIDMMAQDESGKIYLIDYKSNRLGENAAAYHPAALDAAMAEHHYAAQAVIYAIAARRYFAARGVHPATLCIRYLFVRGMQADSGQGVWAWDIDCAKLAALDQDISS